MDFLRLILLFGLLIYGAVATERARSVINEKQKVSDQVSTRKGKAYIRHVAGCETVLPASLVVQDGMLPGTEPDRVRIPDPAIYSETEAIRDANRGVRTSGLKNGVLYTSQKPCTMGAITHAGISKVYFASATASRNSSAPWIPESIN